MSANNKLYFSVLICIGLIGAIVAPTFAQISTEPRDPASYGFTSGRLVATLAAVISLVGAVIGGLAILRRVGRFGAVIALVAGVIGTAVGGFLVATSSGFGTGGGRAGAIVALVLGLISLALGGLALVRARPTRTEVE